MASRVGPVFIVLVTLGCGVAPGGSGDAGSGEGATGASSDTSSGPATVVPTGGGDGGADTSTGGDGSTGSDSSGGATDPGGSTGAPFGPCVDEPTAPGCTACDAMGHPQRLIGVTWNFAGGEPGSGRGSEELRCIVPETGASELIAGIPGMDWVAYGMNAYDPTHGILHSQVYGNEDPTIRFFAIDALAGEVLASPAKLEMTFEYGGGFHVRSDGALVGLTWNWDTNSMDVRQVDTGSGMTVLIGGLAEPKSLTYLRALDRSTDTVYVMGYAIDGFDAHLYAIDLWAGVLLGEPIFDRFKVPLPSLVGGLHWRADGQIVGVTTEGGARLLAIDPATAVIEEVGPVAGLDTTVISASVYDDVSDILFLVDGQHRLVQVDAMTGLVVASPKLAAPNQAYEYNWSGGIHVR